MAEGKQSVAVYHSVGRKCTKLGFVSAVQQHLSFSPVSPVTLRAVQLSQPEVPITCIHSDAFTTNRKTNTDKNNTKCLLN